jgi:protein SCO1/2
MRRRVDGPPTRAGREPRARRRTLGGLIGPIALGLAALLSSPAAAADERDVAATRGAADGGVVETADQAPRAPGSVPALDAAEALRIGQAAIGQRVPDLTLLDRQGRPVRLADYRGKPLLVSFIYTGCFQVCPTQTRALHEAVKGLQRMLGPRQFNVVSIGFNQPFDSHDAMRAFAAQQRIDVANWEFLSPSAAQVPPLTQAFGFSYLATPAGFDHVLGVSVVDATGRIHAQVYGDRLRADQLGVPLRQLLLDAPAPTASPLAAVVERVRILCTIYDPESGEYRYDYKLIFELIGGLLFFGSVAVYFALEWRDRRRQRRRSCTPQPSGNAA